MMLNGIVYVYAPIVMLMILLQIRNVWKKWKGLLYLFRPSFSAETFCITPDVMFSSNQSQRVPLGMSNYFRVYDDAMILSKKILV